MNSISKNWWLVLIKGIILLLLAFYVFQHPVDALVGMALFLGIGLLIGGISLVIVAFSVRKESDNWGWKLAEGILDIIFALVLLSNPAVTAAVFPFIVGFWIIIYGVIIIANSFKNWKEGASNWWMGILGGILGIIAGYFVMTDPLTGAITVTIWIGFGFLILGILSIALAFRLRKMGKELAA